MGSFKKLNTVRDFNDAVYVLPVKYPGIGDTGETITIRSRYNRVFREAQAEGNSKVAMLAISHKDSDIPTEVLDEIQDIQFAALISDWSFDEPCTVENLVEFFKANPQIRDEINAKAAKDSLFLTNSENE